MPAGQAEQPLVINNKSCKRYFIVDGSKVYFTADFDSGNIQKVQQLSSYVYKLHPGFDKTRFSTEKTFFYFKVSGFKMCTVRFLITRQFLLEKFIKDSQNYYRPVFRAGNQHFSPLKNGNVKIYTNNFDDPELSFQYAFQQDDSWVEFAFSYPFSYEENQKMISKLTEKYANHDEIYFHDQVLGYSRDQRKLHLITITEKMNCNKKEFEQYPSVEGMFPQTTSRAYKIDKPKVVISGRVHPGQAPASYCVQGLLNFLLNQKDYRAYLLRKNFHFIIVPMLNPDGVYDGMFRADPLGNNLNRYYKDCTRKKHPTIFFFRKYLQTITDVLFYFDFHAHPSKKGFFIYGNAFDQFIHQVQAQTFGKMIQSNCPYFECPDNIFSEKQMGAKQKYDSVSKQGCGRVFVHRLFGNIIHSYTVQCGYFWPNKLNPYPKIDHSNTLSGDYTYDDSYEHNLSMKQYSQDSYRLMGKAILITILDIFHINPYSRVTLGQFKAISSIRKANAMRIYHQAQRFRMIDSNCYRKAKDIKEKAELYYKQRFAKWGLTISDNYGMKVKKRTFTLDPRLYMLKGLKYVKKQTKNIQTGANEETKQQKQQKQQKQVSVQNQIESERQIFQIEQEQLEQQIQSYFDYQSNKQIAEQQNQSPQKKFRIFQAQGSQSIGIQKVVNKLLFEKEFGRPNQLNNKQQMLAKKSNEFSYSSIKQIVKNARITDSHNLSLSARFKEKNQQHTRSQTINKDYNVFKKNLEFINDSERLKAETQERGLYSQKKDSKNQTKSSSSFKSSRISSFLQKQRKRDDKKSLSVSNKKPQQKKKNLPVLYKNHYDQSKSSKQIMKILQAKEIQKLPSLF